MAQVLVSSGPEDPLHFVELPDFPLRADDADQSIGLDVVMHGEEAYVDMAPARVEPPTSTGGNWEFAPQPTQAFATNQPVTQAVNAARSLMLGGHYQNAAAVRNSILWSIAFLVVLAPLAVRKYRNLV